MREATETLKDKKPGGADTNTTNWKGSRMKKDTKVIIMKAKAPNGNDRTYRTLAPLDFTVADACKMRNISMLTILSATITVPMTAADALAFMQKDMLDEMLDPTKRLVKGSISLIAA